MTEVISPLAVFGTTRYGALDFGVPAAPPAILNVRNVMQARLHHSLRQLPPPMRQEAVAIIEAYCGHPQEFYRLFYQPVWSFLHWVFTCATPPLPQTVQDDACTVQALGLFLHLWDDHLCDGQLKTTQLTLQVRTDAWADYLAAAHRLAQQVGGDADVINLHTGTYLSAIHTPQEISNLDEFCARFERQIAIWTLVPRLVGGAMADQRTGDDLANLLRAFCNAWRLMDDLQDVEADVLAGVESAVWQVLDTQGRAAWSACHVQSKFCGHLEPVSWKELELHLDASGCANFLLAKISASLIAAAELAQRNQWPNLADEILAHRPADWKTPATSINQSVGDGV